MYRERRLVDGALAFHYGALFIYQHEVRNANVRKVHAKGIDPEMVLQFGIPCRDVPGHSLDEAELREEPKSRGQALLAVQAFLRGGCEGWRFRRFRDLDFGQGSRHRHVYLIRNNDPVDSNLWAKKSLHASW